MKPQRLTMVLVAALVGGLTLSAHAYSTATNSPTIADGRIGFGGAFKVGHWTPVWIAVAGDVVAVRPTVEVTAPDSDGLDVTIAAQLPSEIGSSEGIGPTLVYTRVGRLGGSVVVTLANEEGDVLDRRTLAANRSRDDGTRFTLLPATGELLLQIGSGDYGLATALADQPARDGAQRRAVVSERDVDMLPPDWFGYEAVDVLVLAANDTVFCQRLAGDSRRLAALVRWVELGGRLVVLSGREAESVFADDNPLSALLPGRVVEMVALPETSPLEHFAESTAPIARGPGETLQVPRLEVVNGRIEAYAGRQPSDLPLVIRAPFGLGEVTFVGVDLDQPPLADWPGRDAFLRAVLRPYTVEPGRNDASQTLVTQGYSDLSGALRQRLGQSFASVTTISFAVVAVLAIAYLALLGPVDYLLIHKLLRRPWLAWVTFPLIVLLASGGAYYAAQMSKGEGLRVNQLELVDCDQTTGTARGTYWASLYSPHAQVFDLALAAPAGASRETLLSWHGLAGTGVGGMHSGGATFAATPAGYRFAPELDGLEGVPLLTASTKSLVARWTAPLDGPMIEAQLADDGDGLAMGTLTNRTGFDLADAYLLYGGWAYRLGTLADGATLAVGEHLSPLRVRTLLARAARGQLTAASADADREVFLSDRAGVDELLSLMMFYEATGGYTFAQLPNRHQAYCDLSRLLELGRAILVAHGGEASRLVDRASGDALPLGHAEAKVLYRFVLPVD